MSNLRLDAAMRASARWHRNEDIVDSDDHSLALFILDAIDAADRAANIVRVDTTDKALVERIARDPTVSRWVREAETGGLGWFERSRNVTSAVLAALREAAQ
jgi:hypothetical protein